MFLNNLNYCLIIIYNNCEFISNKLNIEGETFGEMFSINKIKVCLFVCMFVLYYYLVSTRSNLVNCSKLKGPKSFAKIQKGI